MQDVVFGSVDSDMLRPDALPVCGVAGIPRDSETVPPSILMIYAHAIW